MHHLEKGSSCATALPMGCSSTRQVRTMFYKFSLHVGKDWVREKPVPEAATMVWYLDAGLPLKTRSFLTNI